MKTVLISTQPKWCELIASGKKTIEVRKTKPKLETPFKAYIYETKALYKPNGCRCFYEGKGKVIGEFVCDSIETIEYQPNYYFMRHGAYLSPSEMWKYGKGKSLYGWHISDLVIYDKPKELSGFCHECNGACIDTKKKIKCERITVDGFSCNGCKPLTRPPQSWCYVVKGGEG